MTLSGIEPATFRLLAQHLSQPSHSVHFTGMHRGSEANISEENVKGKFIPPSIYHTPMIYVLLS
jgi:hypothetical protein